MKHGTDKRGGWLSPRSVLCTDAAAGTVSSSGAHGKTICAAIEYLRAAVMTDDHPQLVRASSDQLDGILHDCADSLESASLPSSAVIGSDMSNEITGNDKVLMLPDFSAEVDVF